MVSFAISIFVSEPHEHGANELLRCRDAVLSTAKFNPRELKWTITHYIYIQVDLTAFSSDSCPFHSESA